MWTWWTWWTWIAAWLFLSVATAWGFSRWKRYQRSMDEVDEIMIRQLEERARNWRENSG